MKVRSLVPMAVLGLYSLLAAASAEDLRQHARQGRNLNPQEVAILEEKVAADPHDLVARSQLLGYYFSRQYNGDRSIPEKLTHHILWLIRNAPEAEILATPYGNLESRANRMFRMRSMCAGCSLLASPRTKNRRRPPCRMLRIAT